MISDEEQHARTVKMPMRQMIAELHAALGPTLVAVLANVSDRKSSHKWMAEGGPIPRPKSLERLQAAHRAWAIICDEEGPETARAWFIGSNPRLGETAPVMALRAGEIPTVLAAARALADDAGGA